MCFIFNPKMTSLNAMCQNSQVIFRNCKASNTCYVFCDNMLKKTQMHIVFKEKKMETHIHDRDKCKNAHTNCWVFYQAEGWGKRKQKLLFEPSNWNFTHCSIKKWWHRINKFLRRLGVARNQRYSTKPDTTPITDSELNKPENLSLSTEQS